MNRINRSILVLLLALSICVLSVLQLNKTVFLFPLLQGFFAVVIFILLIIEIVVLVRSKAKLLTSWRIKKWLLPAVAVLLIPITSYLVKTDGGKKVVIRAESPGPQVYIHMNLYGDGHFKIWHSGPVAGTYYRGQYTFDEDTLKIDNEYLRYISPTLSFVHRENKTDGTKYLEPTVYEDSTQLTYSLIILKGKLE